MIRRARWRKCLCHFFLWRLWKRIKLYSSFQSRTYFKYCSISPNSKVKIYLFPSSYDVAIKVIAYIDTGAYKAMMNPSILPQFVIWTKVFCNKLLDKDLFVGMDVYFQSEKLKILPIGLKYKRDFKPYTNIPKLLSLQ